jgi:hypothetical protein
MRIKRVATYLATQSHLPQLHWLPRPTLCKRNPRLPVLPSQLRRLVFLVRRNLRRLALGILLDNPL